MSLLKYEATIKDNDDVILYFGFNRMKLLRIKKRDTYQTPLGALRHINIIGKKYGSRLQCPKGWVYVLHVTPELWTMTLPHRTQILYSTDISMIMMQLDVKPGMVVIESGTGSGSLSHALLRTLAPSGFLHTFDFHEERSQKAKIEFDDHELGKFVTATHRDVCVEGFGLENVADAVFLDLPKPWLAVPHAKHSMKLGGGRLCSFSPCIEQVQNTCEALQACGFTDLHSMECLVRDHTIQTTVMPVADLGLEDVASKSKKSKANEPEVGNIIWKGDENTTDRVTQSKECVDNEEGDGTGDDCKVNDTAPETSRKKSGKYVASENKKRPWSIRGGDLGLCQCKSASPVFTIPGHTGYLTFATLYKVE